VTHGGWRPIEKPKANQLTDNRMETLDNGYRTLVPLNFHLRLPSSGSMCLRSQGGGNFDICNQELLQHHCPPPSLMSCTLVARRKSVSPIRRACCEVPILLPLIWHAGPCSQALWSLLTSPLSCRSLDLSSLGHCFVAVVREGMAGFPSLALYVLSSQPGSPTALPSHRLPFSTFLSRAPATKAPGEAHWWIAGL
jgi:hypothetical protein